MLKYIVKRILQAIPLMIAITALCFILIDLAPYDAVDSIITDKMTKEQISILEEQSESNKSVFDNLLSFVEPKVGDVYLINAGLVHAIGAGCTILEVQEPTDFTIQPEKWCGEYHLNEREEFLGLSKDIALNAIDFSLYGDDAVKSAIINPKVLIDENGYKKESLISYDNTPCFAENRHTLTGGNFTMDFAPAVYICVDGKGEIKGENYIKEFKKGDYFFLPYSSKNKFSVYSKKCVLIECKPSKQ